MLLLSGIGTFPPVLAMITVFPLLLGPYFFDISIFTVRMLPSTLISMFCMAFLLLFYFSDRPGLEPEKQAPKARVLPITPAVY
jgi:hypothetical protein